MSKPAELDKLIETLSDVYLMTKNGTEFSKVAYIRLVTSLPAWLVIKLKLAPVVGIEKRLNHLMALYEASLTGEVRHIEGVGVGYEVHTSDICIDGIETDYTTDPRLRESKTDALREHFDRFNVVIINRPAVKLNFKLPSATYYDMYKDIEFNDTLSKKMDEVMDATMENVEKLIKTTNSSDKGYSEPLDNFDNDKGMVEWAKVSKVKDLIDEVLCGFSDKAKMRMTEVSAALESDEFTTPLIEALQYGTRLTKGKACNVYLSELGNRYEDTPPGILNDKFALIEGPDLIVGYSKYDNCLRAVFSDKFDNYVDLSTRIRAKTTKPDRHASANKYPKFYYDSVEDIMDDYNKQLDALTGEDDTMECRRSYKTALSAIMDMEVYDTLSEVASKVAKSVAYDVASHMSEIAKSVAAAQKFPARANEYRLGRNGGFASYCLTQMTGTNDSFETGNYIVMYAPKYIDPSLGALTPTVVTPFRTMSRNSSSWRVKLPETLINLSLVFAEANKYEITNRDIAQLFLYSIQNNNNFSSMVEQTRYLFVSATSKKEVIGSIFAKKIQPVMFHKNIFQAVHILKMLKMAEVVTSYAMTGSLDSIMSSQNYRVYLPAIDRPMANFQDCINASYLYTCFNKFSTFKLGRAAKVYDDLLIEKEIYEQKAELIDEELNKIRYKTADDLINWLIFNKQAIVESTSNMIMSGPSRFQFSAFSLLFMMRESSSYSTSSTTLRESLIKSPIDACTMRGGMTNDTSAISMACRAAETIVDGITDSCGRPIMNMENVSIYVLKCVEMVNDDVYMNRIVDKDQVGNRDISVLNYSYRIGALFCETVTRTFAKSVSESVLNDPRKAFKFDEAMRDFNSAEEVMDTNDQSRWGPNALMELFYLSYQLKVKDIDILVMMANTFERVSKKLMRVPDNLIRFQATGKTVKPGTIVDVVLDKVGDDRFVEFKFSMGQGILHQTSDLYHVSGNQFLNFMAKRYKIFEIIVALITSDDCFRILKLNGWLKDWKKIEKIISGIMGLLNIIRNPAKSFLSTHIGEFNSEFYSNGKLVIPSIKKAVSEVDIGAGISVMSDLITSTMKGSTSLADGASMVLSDAVGVASLALTIDQWNYYHGDHHSVLKGGIPSISSLIAMIAGTIGVVSITDDRENVENAFKAYLSDPAEFVNHVDTIRVNNPDEESRARRVKFLETKGRLDGKVLISKDLSSVTNLVTYKRNTTRFSNMIKSLTIDDVTLDRYGSTGKEFLFNLKMQFSYVDNLGGGHDFFKRYTDPSRSFNSKCFKTRSGTLMNRLEYYNYVAEKTYTYKDSPKMISQIVESAIERAQSIMSYTWEEEAELIATDVERKKYPNRIVLDEIAEVSKDEAMADAYEKAEGSNLSKYILANTLVNALYGTAPSSVKIKLYTSKGISPGTAVSSVIMFRTKEKHIRKTRAVAITKKVRALSENALVSKEVDEFLERMALNYNMNRENMTLVHYDRGSVKTSLIIGEKITPKVMKSIKRSAANKGLAHFTSDALAAMMENRLLTCTKFRLESVIINLWYPESSSKLAVVTEHHLETDTWTHIVWGHDDSPVDIHDRRGNKLRASETTFMAIQDTDFIEISMYAPMFFTTICNLKIPIRYAAPKTFESKEEIDKYFDLPEVDVTENYSFNFGARADNAAANVLNDEDITDEEMMSFLACDVDYDIIRQVYRVLGQNMHTSRKVEVSAVEITEEEEESESMTTGILGSQLFEMMAMEENDEMAETVRSETTMNDVNIIRARDSLGYKLHSIIYEMSDLDKIHYTKRLLTRFNKKMIACVLMLARYRSQKRF